MHTLESLITSGRLIDAIIVLLAVEILILGVYHRRTGRGIPIVALVLNAGAGGSLVFALRATIIGSGWEHVAAWLLAALAFHVADLARRWSREAVSR